MNAKSLGCHPRDAGSSPVPTFLNNDSTFSDAL